MLKMKNMFNFYRSRSLALLCFLTLFSCIKDDIKESDEDQMISSVRQDTGVEDLNDIPFTTENMNKAWDEVLKHIGTDLPLASTPQGAAAKFLAMQSIKIVPSHYYYHLNISDSLAYETMTNDPLLNTSELPLHGSIDTEDNESDPTEDGNFTPSPLYTVIPYNYVLPNGVSIEEKIAELYFYPESYDEDLDEGEEKIEQVSNTTSENILTVDNSGDIFMYLELEALKLKHQLDEEELEILRFYLPDDISRTQSYSYAEANDLGYQMSELIMDYTSAHALLNSTEEIEVDTGIAAKNTFFRRRSRWNPSGELRVRDDVLNQDVPLVGAHIKVLKWGFLPIRTTYTNHLGTFRTSRIRTKRVKYSVHFKNKYHRFKVKANSIFKDAYFKDSYRHKRKAWYRTFTQGKYHFYAQVHNAAHDFYIRSVGKFGLHHPNQSWIRIAAKYGKNAGVHLDINPNGQIPVIPILSFFPEIKVGSLSSTGVDLKSDQIYGLVTHEMTHASHYRMDRTFFLNPLGASCRLQTLAESWAEGVETIVTNDRYLEFNPNYIGSGNLNSFASDDRRLYNSYRQDTHTSDISGKEEYTPIVIDMVDSYNQHTQINSLRPRDRVSGYTLKQIQSALNDARGPKGFRENIVHYHQNDTEQFVGELFEEYMFTNCD